MPGRRRDLETFERIATGVQSAFPRTVSGRILGTPRLTFGSMQAAARAAQPGVTLKGRRHYSGIIKAEGVAPELFYTLPHIPADQPNWPHVFAGGALQYWEQDWLISGRTLVIEPGMRLTADDTLWVAYDYLDSIPNAPTSASSGATAATQEILSSTTVLSLPVVPAAGDLIVATANSTGTMAAPAGFIERYRDSGSTVFTKTAVGGETSVTFADSFVVYSGAVAVIGSATFDSVAAGALTSGNGPYALPTPAIGAGQVAVLIGHGRSTSGSLVSWTGTPPADVSDANAYVSVRQVIGTYDATAGGTVPAYSFDFSDNASAAGRGIVVLCNT